MFEIQINKNRKWLEFEKLFKDITRRYDWFLWEFGRRLTYLVHEELLGRIGDMAGSSNYKKRMIVAEIRDRAPRAWWAIVAKAETLQEGEYSDKASILYVERRYPALETDEDPVSQILEKYGPWTVNTIPFVPSQRQALVVLKTVSVERVKQVENGNFADAQSITGLMRHYGIPFETRFNVRKKLRVIRDLEDLALRLEFGQEPGGKAHWRPSVKFGKRGAVRMLRSDKDLIRSMTDPNFNKHKRFIHSKYKLNPNELQMLQDFQKKIRAMI